MTTHTQRILVVGATGNQGGATAQRLLNGWLVRALTSDAISGKARALTEVGAEVVQGNLEDRASLEAVLPELLTLEAWAWKTGWENAEPVPLPATDNRPGQTA